MKNLSNTSQIWVNLFTAFAAFSWTRSFWYWDDFYTSIAVTFAAVLVWRIEEANAKQFTELTESSFTPAIEGGRWTIEELQDTIIVLQLKLGAAERKLQQIAETPHPASPATHFDQPSPDTPKAQGVER